TCRHSLSVADPPPARIYPLSLHDALPISADNLCQGFAGVVLIAFMSSLTDRAFTATQFALLVSLANLPGKFAGGLSGYLVERTSYSTFFVLRALTVVPTLLLLAWLWRRIREPVKEAPVEAT